MWNNSNNHQTLIMMITVMGLLSIASSIFIPLAGKTKRCMIVYSVGESETVKLDINFPPLDNQSTKEYYQLSWKNTENNELQALRIENGKFKKELNLVQNVIYDLCITVVSDRDFGNVYVEYSSHNIFSVNQAEVKVPENLLKSEHITEAFLSASEIEKNIDAFEKIQENRTDTHSEIFRKTNKISQSLVNISMAELIVIIIASAYQFWAISRYLMSNTSA